VQIVGRLEDARFPQPLGDPTTQCPDNLFWPWTEGPMHE
jgi:hypothetical protein